MRYALAAALSFALCAALLVSPAPAADQTINVYVDGKLQNFSPPAIVRDGKAYVPLRQVGTALGATTSYDAATRVITMVASCGTIIRLKQSEGLTINGVMFVPLRKVGEAFGCQVEYDGANSLVRITKPKTGG
jgi:hypothetical protein